MILLIHILFISLLCSIEINTMQIFKNLPDMGLESETMQGGFCVDTVEHSKSGFFVMKKTCTKCGIEKSVDEFYKHKGCKYGFSPLCKKCHSENAKEYYQINAKKIKEKIKKYRENNPERIKESRKKCYENTKEKRKEYYRKWLEKNPEKKKEGDKKYRENHREERKIYIQNNRVKINEQSNKWFKERRNDPVFRLNYNIKCAISTSLKGNKNGRSWEKLVGYTCQELNEHLEKQFKDGMCWENYGRNGWVIDHRIPKSLFNITSVKSKGFKKCWSLENLQPLWKEENREKSNKIFYG